jgi:Uroporphyrinogen decarboxylase (URO-D)
MQKKKKKSIDFGFSTSCKYQVFWLPIQARSNDGTCTTPINAKFPFDLIIASVFHCTIQVILFSDILTPLPGMNIPFDIVKGKGPIIYDPLRTAEDVSKVREFVPEQFVPYVGEALTALRAEV